MTPPSAMSGLSGNASVPPMMIAFGAIALAALPSGSSFLHVRSPRRLPKCKSLAAIVSPLEQMKLDFVGSLENAYDLNPTNAASTSFLGQLVEQVSPESITRDMIESFDQLGTGKWRIVYVQDYSTSFGFGSLFGDMIAAEVELVDGSITSIFHCSNKRPYRLTIEGNVGTARNNMLIEVNDVQVRQIPSDENDGLLNELKEAPLSLMQSILEKNWSKIFSGVVVVDLAFLDESMAVFDLNFLARVNGKRICARKEPDFF